MTSSLRRSKGLLAALVALGPPALAQFAEVSSSVREARVDLGTLLNSHWKTSLVLPMPGGGAVHISGQSSRKGEPDDAYLLLYEEPSQPVSYSLRKLACVFCWRPDSIELPSGRVVKGWLHPDLLDKPSSAIELWPKGADGAKRKFTVRELFAAAARKGARLEFDGREIWVLHVEDVPWFPPRSSLIFVTDNPKDEFRRVPLDLLASGAEVRVWLGGRGYVLKLTAPQELSVRPVSQDAAPALLAKGETGGPETSQDTPVLADVREGGLLLSEFLIPILEAPEEDDAQVP